MKKQTERILRVLFLVIFIFNTLIPSPAAAQAMQPAVQAASPAKPIERTLPAQQAPSYYTPQTAPASATPIASPLRTASPTPRVPSQRTGQPVDFSLSTQTGAVQLNDIITITVELHNNNRAAQTNLSFSDKLESGLEYVPDSKSPVSYDSQKRTITYALASLPAAASTSFSYQLKVTAKRNTSSRGEIRVHTADLSIASGKPQTARVSFGVGTDLASAQSHIAAFDSTNSWHKLGKVSVYMQPGTVSADSVLMSSLLPATKGRRGPQVQFKLDVLKTGAIARDTQGALGDQEVALVGASTEKFKKPAFITIDLSGDIDLRTIPAGQSLYVATYDEAHQVWVKVPIIAKDLATNTVTVQAAHFSTWGAGIGSSLPQNGANVLLFDQPYTSLFTGSAQYSIPVWMPAGRAGMTPSVSLSYSSGGYNGVLGDVQAPWVGGGWNIDGTEIVRKITTSDTGYGYENSFALTVNGTKYDLIEDTAHPGLYNTSQSSFLYIQRHNVALGNAGAVANTGGEWWEVVTTDGTHYRLGWNPDAEQLALMYGYSCTQGNPCITPDGAYASSGYAGKAKDLVALRWRVDQVSDPHGNAMTYTYYEEHPNPISQVAAFDRASYLKTISYTKHLKTDQSGFDLDAGYQVEFVTSARTGDGTPNAFNVWDNYDTKDLDQIKICYGACDGGKVVRTYDLNYQVPAVPTMPNSNGTLVLDNIAISGGNFDEGAISIPQTNSATIRFIYQNLDNRAVTAGAEKYTYPRLQQIQNGYGGSLNYAYGNDGRGTNSWYNWRVSVASVQSSGAYSAVHSYSYATPVYTDGATALTELIGYTDVGDTTYQLDGTTPIVGTTHHFGTASPDTGYELSTSTADVPGTIYSKTVNTYVTDDSKAPFTGWHYRYLYQSENYILSAGALILNTMTRYHRDPATGNLAYREDFKGSTLYRKQYYEYLPNFDPAVHILNKATRELLVDANNAIYADTRYHYDAVINSAPKFGELYLTQHVLSGNITSDASYSYDSYGNMTGSCSYAGYGTLNTFPNTGCQASTTTYDTVLNTYPVTSTNALGFTSSTDYLYTLGMPYHSTDPNGWESTTSYDGLGRTLSTSVPGLSQAGVKYTYPTPSGGSVAAPYSIKMEILDTYPDPEHPVYRAVWGMYDGLGRILQSQVRNDETGQLLVSDTDFNPFGQVKHQSTPHYVSGAGGAFITPNWTQQTVNNYDVLGRLIQVVAPGNIISSTQYDGLTTTSFDPNNHKSVRISDAFGRMTQVQESKEDGSLYAATNYSYDIADHLLKVVDAQNNTTTLQYDLLGRKTSMDDPDMGPWSYQYDALGNLKEQTDAKSQVLQFTYDDLNRLTQKKKSGDVDPLAAYTYGTDPGEKGMRTGMSDTSGHTAWDYNNYGRTVTETRTIGITTPITKASTTTSDWLGRPLTLTYPDNDTVSYRYNALGQAESMDSSAQGNTTLAELAYNQLGQITDTTLGNGATISNTYDSANGTYRLLNRRAEMGATNLMNFSYSYDPAGNITQVVDGKLGETITYQYDSLDRLSFAQDAKSGGGYAYRQTYTYDKIGNILQVDNGSALALAPDNKVLAADNSPDLKANGANDSLVSYKQPALHQQMDTDTPTATETPAPTATATITLTPTITNTPTITATPTKTPIACAGNGVAREVWTGISGSTVSSLVTSTNSFISAPNQAGVIATGNGFEAPANAADLYGQRLRALVCVAQDGAYTFWIAGDESASLRLNTTRLNTPGEANWSTLAAGASQIASAAAATGAREWDKYPSQQSAAFNLSPGYYYIEARMKENTGDDHLAVSWKMNDTSTPADGDGLSIIPGSVLYPPTPMLTATPTSAFTFTPSPTAMVIPNLVAWWKLDEAGGPRYDLSGSNTLTDNNTVGSAIGKKGGAADFEKDNLEYLSRPSSTSLQMSTSDIYVGAWIKAEDTLVSNPNVISKLGADGSREFNLRVSASGVVDFIVYDGLSTSSTIASTTSTITYGTWYYVEGWTDKANRTVWVDINNGTPESVTWASGQTRNGAGASALIIGARDLAGTMGEYWDGGIDEVVYYKRTLSSAERAWLYNNGAGRTYSNVATITPTFTITKTSTSTATDTPLFTSTPTNTPTITPTRTITPTPTNTPTVTPAVAVWHMDETSGATVTDSSGLGHTGALTGGTHVNNGLSNPAIEFGSGTSTYIQIANATDLQSTTGLTVSAWAYPARQVSGTTYTILKKGAGPDYALQVNSSGFIEFRMNDFTPAAVVGPKLPPNTWSQITGIHDATNGLLKLYVNGVLVATKKITSGSLVIDGSPLYIGYPSNTWLGLLDEVRVYNRSLLDSEVTALYNSSPAPAAPNPGINNLAAYWSMDEASGNRADSTGTTTLSPFNNPGGMAGVKSGALMLNSTSTQYVSGADNANVSLNGTSFTITGWMRFSALPSTNQIMVNKWGNAGAYEYYLILNTAGIMNFSVSSNGTAISGVASTQTLSPNTWYHIAAVYNGATLALYINAGTPTTLAYTSGVFNGTSPLILGTWGTNVTQAIDEVAIWKRALTPTEIAWLYNSGAGRSYNDIAPNPGTTNLAAYWSMDEASGNRADSYGANLLTPVNAPGTMSGVKDNALMVNSSGGQYMVVNDNASLALNNAPFTITGWTRFSALPTTNQIIVNKWGAAGTGEYYVVLDTTGKLNFTVSSNGTAAAGLYSTETLSANTWYHFAAVYDGARLAIYVNAGAPTTLAYTSGVFDSSSAIALGTWGTNGTRGIDEVAVYKRALAPAEIAWLYNNGAGRSYSDVVPNPGTTNLAAYWSLDETGGTRNDSFGSNHLTDNNTVTSISGKKAIAAKFTLANGEYLSVGNNAALSMGAGARMTACTWAKIDTKNPSLPQNFIINRGAADGSLAYFLRYEGSLDRFTYMVTSNGYAATLVTATANSLGSPTTGTWYFVCGGYDGAVVWISVNSGARDNTVYSADIFAASTSTLYMGSGLGANYLDGALDETVLYKRSLSPAEVAWLYNNGAGRSYSDIALPVNSPTYTPTPTITGTPPTATPTLTLTATYTPTPTVTGTPPTATPTLSPTPVPVSADQWGSGNDGDRTVSSTFNNINTHFISPRTCADGVAYNVASLASSLATLSTAPAAGCLTSGDEIMLINLQDPTTAQYSVGNYEFLHVAYVSGSQVSFTTQKTKFYGTSFQSDAGIGTGTGNQKVMLMRVPNYNNLSVPTGTTLTANAWDGYKYGVLAFRVKGTLNGSGTIYMYAKGYRGDAYSNCGENDTGYTCGFGSGGKAGQGDSYNPAGGGGAYGTNGQNGEVYALGGKAYGEETLSRIYIGAAGGAGGNSQLNNGSWVQGSAGGPGGGIIFMAANTIGYSGTINSQGAAAAMGGGGGGAGGSVRIEGNSVTLTGATVTVSGGTYSSAGGRGRAAIYHQGSLLPASLDDLPGFYVAPLGQGPTPTPMPTAVAFPTSVQTGNGADGNLTVSGSLNINTSSLNGARSCAQGGDAVAYSVLELAATYARVTTAPATGCLQAGDEIMLINLQGISTNYVNVGNYEILRVGSVTGDRVNFVTMKTRFYGANAGDDSNISVGANNQKVMLMRVPNYNNLSVPAGATLTANGWDGLKYGVLAFRVKGSLTGTGTISMNTKGYRGDGISNCGETYTGYACGFGSGGKAGHGESYHPAGASGAYGTNGQNGEVNSLGGLAYGEATLSSLYFGSAGGGAGDAHLNNGSWESNCCAGGPGGGIILMAADTITGFSGAITSQGGNGGGGGGGAGGAIRIVGNTVTLTGATVSASGGVSARTGGIGRVAVDYWASGGLGFTPGYTRNFSLTATPTPSPTRTPTAGPTTPANPGINNLAAYWSMDEASGNRADSTGTTTLLPSGTLGSMAGIKGSALLLNSASAQYMYAADNANTSLNGTAFTISSWIRFSALPSTNQIIANKWGAAGNYEYAIQLLTNGQIWFGVSSNGTAYTAVASTQTLSANTWYHIATVYNGAQLAIYINAGTPTTLAYTSGVFNGTNVIALGTWGTNVTQSIDEFAIWKRALSANEIAWLYNSGAGRNYTDIAPVNPGITNLAAYWSMDEAAGNRADSTGANLLSPVNAPGTMAGVKGNALMVNSSGGQYMVVNDNASLALNNAPFTITGWTRFSALPTTNQIIVNKWGAAGTGEYYVVLDTTGKLNFTVSSNGTAAAGLYSTETLSANTWYHFAAVYDGARLAIYVNAGAPTTLAYTSGVFDSSSAIALGTWGTNGTRGIDEVAIYKRALTPNEVAWLYNNGAGRSYTDVTQSSATISSYTYNSGAHPHAVAQVADLLHPTATPNSYHYDLNGNMDTRTVAGVTTNFTYNADNRLSAVTGSATEAYLYDGDGARVATLPLSGEMTYYFMGGAYEISVPATGIPSGWKKYYSFGGVAMMDSSTGTQQTSAGVQYFLSDQQGSMVTSIAVNGTVTQQRYLPFGGVRTNMGSTISQTDFGYTGQRNNTYIKLMDYRSRWYDSDLGRFISPDSIIPGASKPEAWNRYAYVGNNPVNRVDPSGHIAAPPPLACEDSMPCLRKKGTPTPKSDDEYLCNRVKRSQPSGMSNTALRGCLTRAWDEIVLGLSLGLAPEAWGLNAIAAMFGLHPVDPWKAQAAAMSAGYVWDVRTGQYRAPNGQFVSPNGLPWPGNKGFATNPVDTTLPKGFIIDRYGPLSGRFASEPGTSISARGLAPGSENMPYTTLRVVEPVTIPGGPIAEVPGFGATGGGMQYLFDGGIQAWIDTGFLEILP